MTTTPAPTSTASAAAASPRRADLEGFRFIQDLGGQARTLLAELEASPAHRSIDEQSTSETMNAKEFKLFSRSSKFSSHVLGKAFKYALHNGRGRPDERLSGDERAQLASLQGRLGRTLMRSKDSALTAGERHLASTEVARVLVELQDFVNKKAAATVVDEGKKAAAGAIDGGKKIVGEARDWFARLLGGSPDSDPSVP